MEFSLHPSTKCAEMPQSSISMHPFSEVSTGLNQQNGKQCCLPTFFLMISPKDTNFHISLNLRVLSLSRMLVEVSLTCIFHHVCEKN